MKTAFSQALGQFASISVIQFIILTVISMVICTACYLFWLHKSQRKMNLADIIPIFCMVIYVNIILQLTFLGRTDGSRIGIKLHMSFKKGKTAFGMLANMYSFLNVMLFVPYGFLCSWILGRGERSKWKNYLVAALLSLAGSLTIELLQLATGRGYYETEDLLCNTLGGIIGICVYILIVNIVNRFFYRIKKDER